MHLIFAFLLVFTTSFLKESAHSTFEKESKVHLTVVKKDGTTIKKTFTEEAYAKLDSSFFAKYEEEVASCTVSFPDGGCSFTASNCADANKGFRACACRQGHPQLCPQT